VKDPNLVDTLYVDELVAPGTVNTMPEATLVAAADHGQVRGDSVRDAYDDARAHMAALKEIGVDYDDVVQVLEDEGVEKFAASWKGMLDSITGELESKAAGA
jgi:transaldolase